jgi:hypothetical protein
VIGLIFSFWSRFSVASVDMPKDKAISDSVSPVITFISAIIADLFNLRNYGYLLNKMIVVLKNILVKSPYFRIFYIDIISEMADIYI